jgi:hypothetical protein
MSHRDAMIAIFADHYETEMAVRKLAAGGFAMTSLSVVGKGYRTAENIVGFHNADDRITFWGTRGAFWGDLWDLFGGGVSLTLPVVGPVLVLGYLAAAIVSAVEGAVLVGGISALGTPLRSVGTPSDSILQYEIAVKADGFLVMARGSTVEMAHARMIVETVHPLLVDGHKGATAARPADRAAPVPA